MGKRKQGRNQGWAIDSGLHTWVDCRMIIDVLMEQIEVKVKTIYNGIKDANYIFMWVFQDNSWLYDYRIKREVRTRDISLGGISWWMMVGILGPHNII